MKDAVPYGMSACAIIWELPLNMQYAPFLSETHTSSALPLSYRIQTHIWEPMFCPTSNVLIWWNAFPRYWIFLQRKAWQISALRPTRLGDGRGNSLRSLCIHWARDDVYWDVVPLVTLCSGAKGRNWGEWKLNIWLGGGKLSSVLDSYSADKDIPSRRFIIVFTKARYRTSFQVIWIQSATSLYIYRRFILILFSHLRFCPSTPPTYIPIRRCRKKFS
jgi:hypothetical protein